MTITDQYLRRLRLTVFSETVQTVDATDDSVTVVGSQSGLDLSDFRVRFSVVQSDIETPNYIVATVYNLSDGTARQIQKEGTRIILEAGYEHGNFGIIFDGQVKQIRRGRESQTDTILTIFAADGDEAYRLPVNFSVAAGSTPLDAVKAMSEAMGLGTPDTGGLDLSGIQYARGKIFFGMARVHLRNIAASTLSTWSIQNGKLQFIPEGAYLPGEAVVLTSATGMIGLPEQTEDGIRVRCLLNPKIKIGTAVQIDNASIQRAAFNPGWVAINQFPTISDDGFYRVIVAEHDGDTRGQQWYSTLTCLAINRTVPVGASVKIDG